MFRGCNSLFSEFVDVQIFTFCFFSIQNGNFRNAHFCCFFNKKFNSVDVFGRSNCNMQLSGKIREIFLNFRNVQTDFFPFKNEVSFGEISFSVCHKDFFAFFHTKNFHNVLLLFVINFYIWNNFAKEKFHFILNIFEMFCTFSKPRSGDIISKGL